MDREDRKSFQGNDFSRKSFPYYRRIFTWEDRPSGSAVRVMQRHENLRFLYVEAGTVVVRTPDTSVETRAGQGVFINRNVVHSLEQKGEYRCVSFMFPAYFLEFYPGSPAQRQVEELLGNEGLSVLLFDGSEDWHEKVLAGLETLSAQEESAGDQGCQYEILTLWASVWSPIQRNVRPSAPRRRNAVSARMGKFLYFVEQHYREEITLEELAADAGVSKSECLRCFKQTLDTTPYRYIMDYRLSKAVDLLINTDRQIGEIAVMTGFGQASYFGKCFRERLGCTPKEYRKGK
ncbi:MAG: AraC family transcriptional regulator [Clostridium sp.]|nr:AraC family transcriptional regulator [Acetatifactor muris]MCM1527355.1 AraC family transcriptional regulator [Bacteroides sp.]MCM1563634.1 AraC family transcriptional regulator [Clostridium sp.]